MLPVFILFLLIHYTLAKKLKKQTTSFSPQPLNLSQEFFLEELQEMHLLFTIDL